MGHEPIVVVEEEPYNGINYDDLPGTVQLVDLQNTMSTKHSAQQTDIVLVPTPSDDPNDPLNWTVKRRNLALTCTCMYVSLMN